MENKKTNDKKHCPEICKEISLLIPVDLVLTCVMGAVDVQAIHLDRRHDFKSIYRFAVEIISSIYSVALVVG